MVPPDEDLDPESRRRFAERVDQPGGRAAVPRRTIRVMQDSKSWVPVPPGSPFPIDNLPYGVFSDGTSGPRVGVAIGDQVLDAGAAASSVGSSLADVLVGQASVDALMAAGPAVWSEAREAIFSWLTDPSLRRAVEPHLHRIDQIRLHLPFTVADYVDFYASEHHAVNVGRIFRPDSDPLPSQWKCLPMGYHGRAGTVAISGTPVVRPRGQRPGPSSQPVFEPTEKLDFEAEVGFVMGVPSRPGEPVDVGAFREHTFGVCLINDWSARDIQSFEYVPLGPLLGKSFLTSISPWIVPLAALEAARVEPPRRSPEPLPHLRDGEPWGLDLSLEIRLNGELISTPPFSTMYWTAAQQLAHLTSNGAHVRTGDLLGSGTVSGPGQDQVGSLLELSRGGAQPFVTNDGRTHSFLDDGDEVVISAWAPGTSGTAIGFGSVAGTVLPSPLTWPHGG